jgi:hypothetical protein
MFLLYVSVGFLVALVLDRFNPEPVPRAIRKQVMFLTGATWPFWVVLFAWFGVAQPLIEVVGYHLWVRPRVWWITRKMTSQQIIDKIRQDLDGQPADLFVHKVYEACNGIERYLEQNREKREHANKAS